MSQMLTIHLSLALALALGCAKAVPGPTGQAGIQPSVTAAPAPWTHLDVIDGSEDFKFVVVSDRTGEHRAGVFQQAVQKTNLIQPAFVVSVGDLIEGYTDDPEELESQWDEMEEIIGRFDAPFFYAAGNHDMSNALMAKEWKQRFGPTYYHFRYKDVMFLVINSELFGMVSDPSKPVPGPEHQSEQMTALKASLDENQDARWTFVFIHQPLWDTHRIHPDWQQVESWLGTRPYTVFAGHIHAYTKHVRHDRRYITLASTGGISELRGLDHGEFDQVVLVTMRNGQPVIANLLLDGIHDEDVRTVDTRQRLEKLEDAMAISATAANGVLLKEGSIQFEVQNEGSAPLQIEGHFEPRGGVEPSPKTIRGTVVPGARGSFDIALRADPAAPLADAVPAVGQWRLTTKKADGSPLVVEQEAWLLPATPFPLPPATGAVTVDGRLDEWPALPYASTRSPLSWARGTPASQHSFRFGTSYDDQFLYVGVSVTDSSPFHAADHIARERDAIQIVLDARPDPVRSSITNDYMEAVFAGTLRQVLIAWLVPGAVKEDPVLTLFLPPLPEGTRQAAARTADGYTAELAVPRKWLDERQKGPWSAVRMNVSVQDVSREGDTPASTWWRPSRFGSSQTMPIPGSGTFVKQ